MKRWIPIGDLKPTAVDLVPLTHVFDETDSVFTPFVCSVCQTTQLTKTYSLLAVHCDAPTPVDMPRIDRVFPLPDAQEPEMALHLMGLPVCLVQVGSTWGFGLVAKPGAARWELVEAYMRFGYLPPYSLIEGGLGNNGTKAASELNRWILAGASATAKAMWKRADLTTSILTRERDRIFERRPRR